MAYNIKTAIFEGPLDLLLHLIRKNEVDIYDIPISEITEQYMEYLDILKALDLNVAGEFILMASTLVLIKSKMLLPIDEEAQEEDDYDPRDELVERLLEYQKFKEAAGELDARNILGRDVFTRGQPYVLEGDDEDANAALVNITVFDLMEALQEVIERIPKDYTVDLTTEQFNIVDKINLIMETLEEKQSATFISLFPTGGTKGEVIATFLAILELCKMLLIRVNQSEDKVIRVYLPPESERGEMQKSEFK
ncbi:MAG: segregation/condensation protein A [Proteobacteria bacterium]|nr:segregation/condensation protein A [Pseudomonadota bacterium]